jgi:hypothetical protein
MDTKKRLGLRSEPALLTHNPSGSTEAHEPTYKRPIETMLRGSGVCRPQKYVRRGRTAFRVKDRHR